MKIQYAISSISAILFASVLAAGCGGGGDNDVITIGVIPKGATHEHWKSVHLGAQVAAGEEEVEIIWQGPIREDDREDQLQVYQTLMARGVDAICIAPIDDRVFVLPVREAKEMGIPTVVFDSALQGEEHAAFVSTDNYRGGVIGAELIGELLGGRGRLIVMRYQEGSAATTYREDGFMTTMRDKYPDIEILSENQYSGATTETAYRTSEALLNRFPEFEAIWTPNESATFGCLRALQERGLAGKVVFVGFDTSEKLVEAMEAGEIQGLSIQDPFAMGYLSVKTAVAAIKGEPIESYVDTGVYMATPDNMNEPDIRALLEHDFSGRME